MIKAFSDKTHCHVGHRCGLTEEVSSVCVCVVGLHKGSAHEQAERQDLSKQTFYTARIGGRATAD